MQEIWTAVDEYVAGLLVSEGPALETVAKENQAAGLPAIAISPPQGKLLYLLACAIRATDILEFGTLGAYSTIWLARALPSTGRLTTLEADPGYAEVAHENIDRAGSATASTSAWAKRSTFCRSSPPRKPGRST